MRAGPVDVVRGVQLREDGRTVRLTELEVRLLEAFANHAGEDLSRDQLLRWVWGLDPDRTSTRTIDVAIRRLREKVELRPSAPDHLRSVRGVGYRFVADGDPTPDPAALHRGGVVIDLERGEVVREGASIGLDAREVAVVRALAAGRRRESELDGTPRAVRGTIARLRGHLEADPTRPAWLVGGPTAGYALAPASPADLTVLVVACERALAHHEDGTPDAVRLIDAARPILTHAMLPSSGASPVARIARVLAQAAIIRADPGRAIAVMTGVADRLVEPADRVDVLFDLGQMYLHNGTPELARVARDAALELAQRHQLHEMEARLRIARGDTGRVNHDAEGSSEADIEAGLALATRHGLGTVRAFGLHVRSNFRLRQGRFAEAVADAREMVVGYAGHSARRRAMSQLVLARTLAEAGDLAEARELAVALVAAAVSPDGMAAWSARAGLLLGQLDHAAGATDAARPRIEDAIARLDQIGRRDFAAPARVALAQIELDVGDPAAARGWLGQASAAYAILPAARAEVRLWTAVSWLMSGDGIAASTAAVDGLAPTNDARVAGVQDVLGAAIEARCGLPRRGWAAPSRAVGAQIALRVLARLERRAPGRPTAG